MPHGPPLGGDVHLLILCAIIVVVGYGLYAVTRLVAGWFGFPF